MNYRCYVVCPKSRCKSSRYTRCYSSTRGYIGSDIDADERLFVDSVSQYFSLIRMELVAK